MPAFSLTCKLKQYVTNFPHPELLLTSSLPLSVPSKPQMQTNINTYGLLKRGSGGNNKCLNIHPVLGEVYLLCEWEQDTGAWYC